MRTLKVVSVAVLVAAAFWAGAAARAPSDTEIAHIVVTANQVVGGRPAFVAHLEHAKKVRASLK